MTDWTEVPVCKG